MQELCRQLHVLSLQNGDHPRWLRVPFAKKVEMAVWTLATKQTYRETGNLFGMRRSNAHYCAMQIFGLMASLLKQTYIKWPSTAEYKKIADAFESRFGFPGVVGCIDGTHVPIKVPSSDRNSYINRKGYPSINVLAVCDHKMRFTCVYADRAGSVHDARVLRVSPLGQDLQMGTLFDDDHYHLLGDSGYPLLSNIMVPYRDNGHLSSQLLQRGTFLSTEHSWKVVRTSEGKVSQTERCRCHITNKCITDYRICIRNTQLHNSPQGKQRWWQWRRRTNISRKPWSFRSLQPPWQPVNFCAEKICAIKAHQDCTSDLNSRSVCSLFYHDDLISNGS